MPMFVIAVVAGLLSVVTGMGAERLEQPVRLAGNFLQLTLSHNAGVAFGIALPPLVQELLIACAFFAVLAFAFRSKQTAMSSLGFGLILGGAVANLIDRIPDGLVTDFIAVGTFPIFNIADACITIGAGLLLLENTRKK